MYYAFLCKAFQFGLYGPRIVWIFSTLSLDFWRPQGDVECSEAEMLQAVEGAFFMGSFSRNTRAAERGIAGITGADYYVNVTMSSSPQPLWVKVIETAKKN